MRVGIAIIMILHGLAHLPGFLVPWRLASPKDLPYKTTIVAGRFDLGDAGIRLVGVLWLATLMATVAAGAGLLAGAPWAFAAAFVACAVSLVLSLASLPEARVGVVFNIVLLAALAAGGALGWMR
jgi:hypothetical protein